MKLSLFDTPSRCFQLEHPRRSFPVMPHLVVKKKGEAPKCKTCAHFSKYGPGRCSDPMKMACDGYSRHPKKERR